MVEAAKTASEMERSIDETMDRLELQEVLGELPLTSGAWQIASSVDNLTDEQLVEAVALVEGNQARYQVALQCAKTGLRTQLTTFDPASTEPKGIPWESYEFSAPHKELRLRIDSGPAFTAELTWAGYVNSGTVTPMNSSGTRVLYAVLTE